MIADITYAVDSPQRLSVDRGHAARLLDLVPSFPTVTWGQDDLRTGEMWNSPGVRRAAPHIPPSACPAIKQRNRAEQVFLDPAPARDHRRRPVGGRIPQRTRSASSTARPCPRTVPWTGPAIAAMLARDVGVASLDELNGKHLPAVQSVSLRVSDMTLAAVTRGIVTTSGRPWKWSR